MGATVEMQAVAGYHALKQNSLMQKTFADMAELVLGRNSVTVIDDSKSQGGSTDMGDLSTIIPVIHPYTNAAAGTGHGDDYLIEDYDRAVVAPAKVMSATVLALLSDGAKMAREVVEKHEPSMTTEQYVATQRERFKTETYEPS